MQRITTSGKKLTSNGKCIRDSIIFGYENARKKDKKSKKPWMTDEILNIMTERKQAKNTPRYEMLDKQIQQKCKETKEAWLTTQWKI
jgi:hypothetical protein